MEDIIIPDHLCCPICTQIMKNPVQLNGNKQYTFCGFCIAQWLQLKKSNPMTNEPLKDSVLIPDNTLNLEIKELYSTAKAKCDWLILQSNEHQNEYNRAEAVAAKEWFDEKLFHLKSSYEWTPWMQQTAMDAIQVLMHKFCNTSNLELLERQKSEFTETLEQKEGERDHEEFDDHHSEKVDLTEREILECIEYIESYPFEEDEDSESIRLVEQIRAEGKKLIDDKCNETIQKIQTFSSDGVETEQMVKECQHSVTFVSTIISGIGKVIKYLTGWISQFFLFYIRKILQFLAIAGNENRM